MSKDLALQLHILQRQLNVPKKRYNKFANYYYRNAEDILEEAKKLLPGGCYISLSDDIIQVGDRIYLKATATFSDGVSEIKAQALAREPLEKKGSDASQITGGCSTYARRYALSGLLAIDEAEDTDNHDNRDEPYRSQQSSAKPIVAPTFGDIKSVFLNKDQVFKLSETLFKSKLKLEEVYNKYGVTGLEQLTNAQAKEIAAECQARYASV